MSDSNFKVEINIKDFKGIKKINETWHFNNKINSVLVYAPNGTGKTSLTNAFKERHQTPKAPKKNKVSKKEYEIEVTNDSKKIFLVFDSFNDSENFGIYQMFLSSSLQESKVKKSLENIKRIIKENPEINILKNNKRTYKENFGKKIIYGVRKNKNILLYNALFNKNISKEDFESIKKYIEENEKIIKKTILKLDLDEISALIKFKNKKRWKNFVKKTFGIEVDIDFLIREREEIKKRKKENKERFKYLNLDLDTIDNNKYFLKKLKFNKLLKFKFEVENYILEKYKDQLDELLKELSVYESVVLQEKNKVINFNRIKDEYKEIFPNTPIDFHLVKRRDEYIGEFLYNIEMKVNELEANGNREEKALIKEVSVSEKRSIYIFSIINKINKIEKENVILVFDDLIDSFDEVNQISFIYYLKKLENKNINFIVFTHNYAFYKVLNYKLNNKKSFLMTKHNDDISILDDEILGENGSNMRLFRFLYSKNFIQKNRKISLILSSITREMLSFGIFYKEEKNVLNDFEKEVSNYLHFKEKTSIISFSDYIAAFENYLVGDKINLNTLYKEKSYLSVLLHEANSILDNNQKNESKENIYFMLVDKIIIAIAIRLTLEKRIIDMLGEGFYILSKKGSKEPQTTFLIKEINKRLKTKIIFKNVNNKIVLNRFSSNHYFKSIFLVKKLNDEISEKSNFTKFDIASSNIIHLNSLRHEALFYYDINYLKEIYKEIKDKDLLNFIKK